jgi:hypothetical protein
LLADNSNSTVLAKCLDCEHSICFQCFQAHQNMICFKNHRVIHAFICDENKNQLHHLYTLNRDYKFKKLTELKCEIFGVAFKDIKFYLIPDEILLSGDFAHAYYASECGLLYNKTLKRQVYGKIFTKKYSMKLLLLNKALIFKDVPLKFTLKIILLLI